MTDFHIHRGHQEDYRGPSREELGVLADRVIEAEASMTGDVDPFVHRHPAGVAAPRRRDKDRENYHGPTPEELGVLADHVSEAEASMTGGVAAPHLPAPSHTPVHLALWETDLSGSREVRVPVHDARRGKVSERPRPDSFLRQLDEVEASLRKKIDSRLWVEG